MYRVSRRALSTLTVTLSASALLAAGAQATILHVNGQQTTITPSSQATEFLTNHHITVTPLGVATLSGGSLTLPIVGGRVGTPKLNGFVRHQGGVTFSGSGHSVSLRAFVLARVGKQAFFLATVGGKSLRVARVTGWTQTIVNRTATIKGELELTVKAASKIDHLFGKHVVGAGADIGSFTSTVTVA